MLAPALRKRSVIPSVGPAGQRARTGSDPATEHCQTSSACAACAGTCHPCDQRDQSGASAASSYGYAVRAGCTSVVQVGGCMQKAKVAAAHRLRWARRMVWESVHAAWPAASSCCSPCSCSWIADEHSWMASTSSCSKTSITMCCPVPVPVLLPVGGGTFMGGAQLHQHICCPTSTPTYPCRCQNSRVLAAVPNTTVPRLLPAPTHVLSCATSINTSTSAASNVQATKQGAAVPKCCTHLSSI
jgi:hypothetical protein